MPLGSVKWFNAQKGFGFIAPDEPGNDVFVHISAVRDAGMEALNEGQRLEYELITVRDGRVAAGDLKTAD